MKVACFLCKPLTNVHCQNKPFSCNIMFAGSAFFFLCDFAIIVKMFLSLKGPGTWVEGHVLGVYLGCLSVVFLLEVSLSANKSTQCLFLMLSVCTTGRCH